MSEAVYDEKVRKVLSLLAEGKTKDEISKFYNQKWKTIYIYMNRKNFLWDNEQNTFVEKVVSTDTKTPTIIENTKAAQIIRMFDVKHPDIKKIAIKHGFQSVEVLGEYMKSQGYRWSDEQQNYVEDVSLVKTNLVVSSTAEPSIQMDERMFIQFLMQHQSKLLELLGTENATGLITYKFKGSKVQKTLSLASSAAVLIKDYSLEFNMSQRLVVETALAEFFERHGYKDRLRAVTV